MVTRVCGHLRHTLLAVGVLAFTGMAVSVSAQEVENIERIVTRSVCRSLRTPYFSIVFIVLKGVVGSS